MLLLGAATGCDDAPPRERDPASSARATDTLEPLPTDIVSLTPQASRFLLRLGAGDRITAVGDGPGHPPEVAHRPRVDLEAALALAPGWLFVSSLRSTEALAALRPPPGTRVVELEPHDLEDLFALSRTIGRELVGRERALAFEVTISRPLSILAAESPATGRPRVVAVVDDAPLTIAGGHSFASDLLEIAGAASATHGSEDHERRADATSIRALEPDLVVLMLSEPTRIERARQQLPAEIPDFVFSGRVEDFWAEAEPVATARALREALLGAAPPAAEAGGPGAP